MPYRNPFDVAAFVLLLPTIGALIAFAIIRAS
jgi:hypothetical protein